ncbi:MAG: hypothetical protein B6D41_02850 [Chloroflexi bacterium UTCFX4]|jgi:FKBP-type peptidyl-prolyl cis-trans isomerase|nr:MAG: hypothetical protein B6D41_02850 [Chloroflexi bacterium UTCFX4]
MALAQKKKKRTAAKPRAAQRKLRMTYRQVLARVRALSPADRERLRAELEKQPRVYILKPDLSPEAVRRGQQMAAEIRQELAAQVTGTLEETMIELRGRSWMS